MWLILFFLPIHFNNNVLFLKVCYNHCVLKITWRILVLINNWATVLFLKTYVFKKLINYTNMLVSVTTNNNSKILLRTLWFLILEDSPITVPDLPWYQHQSRNQVRSDKEVSLLLDYLSPTSCATTNF